MTSSPSPHPGSAPTLGRRALLTAAGVIGASAATSSWWSSSARAEATVGFAELRARYRELLLGTDFDTSDPLIAAGISDLSDLAVTHRGKILTDPNRDRVFSDLPYTKSANINTTFSRLSDMARAHGTPGTSSHDDPSVVADIIAGLAHAEAHAYHAGADEWDNWWHWEIGTPVALANTLILLDGLVPVADVERHVAAMDWFVADPAWQFERYPNRTNLASAGTNRVDLCRNAILIGLVGESSAHMDLAADRLGVAFRYGSEDPGTGFYDGQGLYPDGSFLYQGSVPYTGSYGIDLLTGLARLLGLLGGSPWAIEDPRMPRILDSIEQSYVPIIFRGQVMDGVRGRSIARYGSVPYTYGRSLVDAMLRLAPAADPATAARWRAIAKGWLESSPVSVFEGGNLPRISLFKELLTDPAVPSAPELTELRMFPRMARAIHRGPGWACMVSIASDRVSVYDYQLGENYRGGNTASGWTQLYTDDDLEQYIDDYWATANIEQLAGTTVDSRTLPRGAGGGGAGKTLAPNAWGGGAILDGQTGAFGQHLHGVASTMTARQSWFFLPGKIVALGADITGGGGAPLITTLEHRRVDPGTELTVDGTVQDSQPGWDTTVGTQAWVHLADTAGWVLLDSQVPLQVARRERTGTWQNVNDNVNVPDTEFTHQYVTLSLDHGGATVAVEKIVDTHDGADAFEFHGWWVESSTVRGVRGGSILATSASATEQRWCAWHVDVPRAGRWEVAVSYPYFHNNPTAINYTVSGGGLPDPYTVTLDQTTGGSEWQVLGVNDLTAGLLSVRLDNASVGFAKADAIRIREVRDDTGGPNSRYAYVFLPRATAAATADEAADPSVQVLANSSTVQAVAGPDQRTMANFFAAGEAARIQADGPCSVVVQGVGREHRMAVSDPTAQRDEVVLTLRLGPTQSGQSDTTVTSSSEASLTTVRVDTSDRDGRTHHITLTR